MQLLFLFSHVQKCKYTDIMYIHKIRCIGYTGFSQIFLKSAYYKAKVNLKHSTNFINIEQTKTGNSLNKIHNKELIAG
jgi:hypothetical protein